MARNILCPEPYQNLSPRTDAEILDLQSRRQSPKPFLKVKLSVSGSGLGIGFFRWLNRRGALRLENLNS